MKKVLFYSVLTVLLTASCNNSEKPDYSNAHTLRDSLITKFKFDYKSDTAITDEYIVRVVDSVIFADESEKYIRFSFFEEYKDTLLAYVDYFFSDTLDKSHYNLEDDEIKYINLLALVGTMFSDNYSDDYLDITLLKNDYSLSIEYLGAYMRIKYQGGNPNINTDLLMDSIANHIHDHLESNLNYFYYEVDTDYEGYPIIDIYNNTTIDAIRSLAEELAGSRYVKYINNYEFRLKKYSKKIN
jgi:hypothetical protein